MSKGQMPLSTDRQTAMELWHHKAAQSQQVTGKLDSDCISRQAAIDALDGEIEITGKANAKAVLKYTQMVSDRIKALPSAQPKPLTDKEQRIFLAAMSREEKVCKKVDAEMTREPYEDSLVRVCREIERKVKCALWTN